MSEKLDFGSELRQAIRLSRGPEHSWQLCLEDDFLITKNIVNLSATGLAFKAPSSSAFYPGQTLKFNLSIEPGLSFECEGRVLWASPSSGRPGSMSQVGLQFSKLPMTLDSAIMRQIHEFALRSRRERIQRGRRPLSEKIVMSAPPSLRSILVSVIGGVIVMALTGAFVMALWLNKQSHPEQSIAHKFNKGLLRKLSSSPTGQPTSSDD